MKQYRFEQIHPRITNLSKNVKKYFRENLNPLTIHEHITRYAYDNSDFTAWHLFYGDNKEQMKIDKNILTELMFKEKAIFNVSGNGWGTGLSIMANLSSYYDK